MLESKQKDMQAKRNKSCCMIFKLETGMSTIIYFDILMFMFAFFVSSIKFSYHQSYIVGFIAEQANSTTQQADSTIQQAHLYE